MAIVWVPPAMAGAVRDSPVNAPVLLVEEVPEIVTGLESIVTVSGELAANPFPETVTAEPTAPLVADGVTRGVMETDTADVVPEVSAAVME